MGRTWDMNPRMVMWIYQMLVRPILTYAAVVLRPKVFQKTAAGEPVRIASLPSMVGL